MKILVTGANGFTGMHLCINLVNKGFDVFALGRGDRKLPILDGLFYYSVELTSVRTLLKIFDQVSPDVVIHTAAMSKPDICDLNREDCLLNNVEVTRYLLEASRHFPVHFIYLSTDFIFGENGPHKEEDTPGPLNFYGESKLQAEKLILQTELTTTIIRPVFIYGPVIPQIRPSFIQWVQQKLLKGEQIKVVTDQLRTPTYVMDLCDAIATILIFQKIGIYHIAGKDILSPYEMAITVAKVLDLDAELIKPVTSETFPEPVRRAKKSGLYIDKAIRELNYTPHSFEDAVKLSFLKR
ncbi:MAG: SDR family oxidoreductase [Chitinophagaceae bacterium]|nr:SDR family oxidoreductase [Chitinophagaceae bacterium]